MNGLYFVRCFFCICWDDHMVFDFYLHGVLHWGFPGSTSGKEPTCQCRRCKRLKFDSWAEKIPWKVWQPTPVFLPREFPWTEEPSKLQPMGLKSHDWVTTQQLSWRLHVWLSQELWQPTGKGRDACKYLGLWWEVAEGWLETATFYLAPSLPAILSTPSLSPQVRSR